MKRLLILLTVFITAAVGWHLAGSGDSRPGSRRSGILPDPAAPTSTLTDPTLVFQKAFWKRPTSEDRILQAERREWADNKGVQKWQWFIAVKPSPVLVEHLITQNAFMLSTLPLSEACEHPEAPAWFPEAANEDTQVLANSTRSFLLFWDPKNNLLHATDSGSGFSPGAPEPARVLTVTPPQGRIPTTPPPKP